MRKIILIYDEVQTGVGRTGEWLFAGSDAGGGVVPDIVTLAKALGSGIPVGACLVSDKVAAHIKENDLGTTFGGGMIAMAAVTATLEAIENGGMLENVKRFGSICASACLKWHCLTVRGAASCSVGVSREAAPITKRWLDQRIITRTQAIPRSQTAAGRFA